ncbi:conserved hypothetical protein [Pediculus humanus corporis]|uniref:Uncharacterized protein n=1 Tax=Pediculus humanus subsp. corporis TaxID=121224 RepID=E0VTB5_PEDHC|nr:uncharacterized protein Phum_PHUM430250 [Pediculus humanus corporis]EEB16621.1 conserved hypothetical protein [Pediculus humanus corporis]
MKNEKINKNHSNVSIDFDYNYEDCRDDNDDENEGKVKPCYKKRIIKIRRIGKTSNNNNNSVEKNNSPFRRRNDNNNNKNKKDGGRPPKGGDKKFYINIDYKNLLSKRDNNNPTTENNYEKKKDLNVQNESFPTESHRQQLFIQFWTTAQYNYDMNKITNPPNYDENFQIKKKSSSDFNLKKKSNDPRENHLKFEDKIWKSKVLETATTLDGNFLTDNNSNNNDDDDDDDKSMDGFEMRILKKLISDVMLHKKYVEINKMESKRNLLQDISRGSDVEYESLEEKNVLVNGDEITSNDDDDNNNNNNNNNSYCYFLNKTITNDLDLGDGNCKNLIDFTDDDKKNVNDGDEIIIRDVEENNRLEKMENDLENDLESFYDEGDEEKTKGCLQEMISSDEFTDAVEDVFIDKEDGLNNTTGRGGGGVKRVEFRKNPSLDNILTIKEEDNLIENQGSDESFSLYYSKAADLASPLLDMKRFIYPDHIHYSYKHVKKKGFDVDLNGSLPLLVRQSLTMNDPINVKKMSLSQKPEMKITRKPMDLSFAASTAFSEWQNLEQYDPNETHNKKEDVQHSKFLNKKKNINNGENEEWENGKKICSKRNSRHDDDDNNTARDEKSRKGLDLEKGRTESYEKFMKKCPKGEMWIHEKLYKTYKKFNKNYCPDVKVKTDSKPPTQISSTQLHSNKGRINSTYNPAIFLNENKSRVERDKKIETPKERTKDMFAKLEREILFQSKNFQKHKKIYKVLPFGVGCAGMLGLPSPCLPPPCLPPPCLPPPCLPGSPLVPSSMLLSSMLGASGACLPVGVPPCLSPAVPFLPPACLGSVLPVPLVPSACVCK